jgi:hypothetical protein
MKKSVGMFLVLLLLSSLTGCASVSLQDSWKDPGATTKQYRKLLIVGLAEKAQMRQVFEEVFASEAVKKGVVGIASYTITGVDTKPSRESLEKAVKKSGADAVVTTRLVGYKKDSDVRTGFVLTSHGTTAMYGVPVSYATFVHQPVEVTTSTKAAIETNLFDAETGLMVWSVTTRAVDPEGIITITRDVADIAIKALAKDGLL